MKFLVWSGGVREPFEFDAEVWQIDTATGVITFSGGQSEWCFPREAVMAWERMDVKPYYGEAERREIIRQMNDATQDAMEKIKPIPGYAPVVDPR